MNTGHITTSIIVDEVVIIYSYKVRQGNGFMQPAVIDDSSMTGHMHGMGNGGGNKKYIKLSIKKTYYETHSDGHMSFQMPDQVAPGKTKKLRTP